MRPSIYIGLGGTGIRAIAQTKKLYEDVYGVGNIPKCIAFLAIDFNLADIKSPELPTSLEEDAIMIQYNGSPKEHYEGRVKRGAYSWVFPGNTDSLAHRISDGAGQVRTTGRFYTEYILNIIDAALQQRWLQVSNITYTDENGLSVPCQEIDIHVVMSLAGGTGAGSFINVAELISRKYGKRAHIFGYGVLHGVFRTQDPYGTHTPKVRVNAYSAIVDLDYLMHASVSNPVKIEINGGERELTSPIFNEFFVIDNQTANGNLVPNVKELCAAVGTCLFASSGDMGSTIQGGQSNNRWQQGSYGILHKKGWVQALGGCQIVYKGDQLAQIYGCKAAIELIRKMCQEGAEAQQLAQDWTEEAGVREDGEQYNMLIDSIVEPKTIDGLRLPMVDADSTVADNKSIITSYINNLADIPADDRVKEMMEEKKQSLLAKIRSLLSVENGVGNSRIFLKSLISLCEKYRMEMVNEAEQNKATLQSKSALLEKAIKEYEEYCDRLFKTRSGKEERLETISKIAKDISKINYEIKRREIARDIFINLKKETEDLTRTLNNLDELLKTLSADYSQTLTNLQNPSASSCIFEYDLSVNDRLKMTLKEDVSLASLLRSLPASLLDLDIETQLRPAIEKYIASLPQAVEYREKRIIDIINNLDDNAYTQLRDAIETKASSLLRLDNRSQENENHQMPMQLMVHEYMVSLYCDTNEQCRLQQDPSFISKATGQAGCKFIPNPCEALRQKMFVFRAEYAIIPYCIELFGEDVVEEYERQVATANMGGATFNPHFDKNMYEMMVKNSFKLEPELPNEAMFYWVCGQLFGYHDESDPNKCSDVTETVTIMEKGANGETLRQKESYQEVHCKYICCRKGKYYFWEAKNKQNGQDRRWYLIGGSTSDKRNTAFENFKAVTLPAHKAELRRLLLEIFKDMGGRLKPRIQEIIDMGKMDYIDRVMCSNRSSSTYYSQRTYEASFVDDEWDYIENQLMNAVESFK